MLLEILCKWFLQFFSFCKQFYIFFGLKFWLYIFLNLSEAIRINTAKTLIAFTSLSLSPWDDAEKKPGQNKKGAAVG